MRTPTRPPYDAVPALIARQIAQEHLDAHIAEGDFCRECGFTYPCATRELAMSEIKSATRPAGIDLDPDPARILLTRRPQPHPRPSLPVGARHETASARPSTMARTPDTSEPNVYAYRA